ncbi:MAG TPA: PRC-barrel domain-containing protein [Ktedonobacteraceae bacterium]|nr:PRC-barrel domain-containing protein [Ktedonobacteraceae bacterium]
MSSSRTILRIEDLIGSKIVTAEGKRLGSVVDIHITREREPEVIALVYGQFGWLYRLGVLMPFSQVFGLQFKPRSIPWKAVATFEHLTITLKSGYEAEQTEGS